LTYHPDMKAQPSNAEVNTRLRARAQDRTLIDQAAELMGAMLYADAITFQKVMDWIDAPATQCETAGMKRLLRA